MTNQHSQRTPGNNPGHRRIAWRPGFTWTIGALVVVLTTISAGFIINRHVIVAESVKKDKVTFVHIVNPGDKFSTSYIHSVELSPVGEYFRIDENFQIVLYETTFCSSNVGLPYAAFGQEVFHTEKDKFRISNMHRIIPELLIWANKKYENQLEFGGVDMALYGSEEDTLIRVRITKMPIIKVAYLILRDTEWH